MATFRPKIKPNEVEKLYLRWLKGEPLRKIASSIGVRHQALDYWFKKTYGFQSTNLQANSLVRSLFQDYPNSVEVRLWAAGWAKRGEKENHYHRSNHNIKQLTNYQVLDDPALMDFLACDEPENLDRFGFLRLPLYLMMADKVLSVLLLASFQAQLRLIKASQEAGDG